MKTRLLVEREFGITVEKQIEIEEYLRGKNDLGELLIDLDYPADWTRYYDNYVFPSTDGRTIIAFDHVSYMEFPEGWNYKTRSN
jgi:hypothetical protein